MDSGAAGHAWPFKTKSNSSRGGTFLTATGAPVASQGTLDVSFQLVDVHGVEINVRATFELLPVRRPILGVSRLVEKGFAVVMGKEQGNTLCKDGRVIDLHKSPKTEKPKISEHIFFKKKRKKEKEASKGYTRDGSKQITLL